MSPCHTALHLCIFLSLAGTLPCPSAVTLSPVFTSVSPSFSPSTSTRVSHSTPSSCPAFCLSNQLLLTTEALFPSTLYLPQQPSKCYPHSLTCSVSTFFHFSSGATFFLPVIVQPQLNSKSGMLFHNIALSFTHSAFVHAVSSVSSVLPPFLPLSTSGHFFCVYNTQTEA